MGFFRSLLLLSLSLCLLVTPALGIWGRYSPDKKKIEANVPRNGGGSGGFTGLTFVWEFSASNIVSPTDASIIGFTETLGMTIAEALVVREKANRLLSVGFGLYVGDAIPDVPAPYFQYFPTINGIMYPATYTDNLWLLRAVTPAFPFPWFERPYMIPVEWVFQFADTGGITPNYVNGTFGAFLTAAGLSTLGSREDSFSLGFYVAHFRPCPIPYTPYHTPDIIYKSDSSCDIVISVQSETPIQVESGFSGSEKTFAQSETFKNGTIRTSVVDVPTYAGSSLFNTNQVSTWMFPNFDLFPVPNI